MAGFLSQLVSCLAVVFLLVVVMPMVVLGVFYDGATTALSILGHPYVAVAVLFDASTDWTVGISGAGLMLVSIIVHISLTLAFLLIASARVEGIRRTGGEVVRTKEN